MLTETTFLQAYRNWLMVIDVISTPDMAIRWNEHHSRMPRDDKFMAFSMPGRTLTNNYIPNSSLTPSLLLILTVQLTYNFWREPEWTSYLLMLRKHKTPLRTSRPRIMEPT